MNLIKVTSIFLKIKVTPTFERLNNLKRKVFELSTNHNYLSPKYVRKNYYDEQTGLLLYENHLCLITNLLNFCGNNEYYKLLCRRCLKTYGDQTKLEQHMLIFIEQEVCNISYMYPHQKVKFKGWYMKVDPPSRMAADFECINVLFNDNDNDNGNNNDDNNNDNGSVNVNDNDNDDVTVKLVANKPVAIGYIMVKHPDYENPNLEKDGSIKYFGKDCVEWFLNENLEIEGYMKNDFQNEVKIDSDTTPENYGQTTCRLCEKEFKPKDVKEKRSNKDHCHL